MRKLNYIKKISANEDAKKVRTLKGTTISFSIAILAIGMTGFVCDCIFISKGITVDGLSGDGNNQGFKIQETLATIMLSVLGAYICLLGANMVVFGLRLKKNLKQNLYLLITISAAFIATTICVIKAAEMMINKMYVLDITITITTFEFKVYHLDFLKGMSIPPGAVIFGSVILLLSFKKFTRDTLIKDANALIIIYAALIAILFIPFMVKLGGNDPQLPSSDITEIIVLIQSSITGKHIVSLCTTSPMSVFAGMLMVLLIARVICVIFAYNNRGHEKKNHLIIFSIITFLVIAGFIASHVSAMDFEKLFFEYDSIKLPILLLTLAESVTCLAAGAYCLISHIEYKNRAI